MQFQIPFAPNVLDKVINIYLCHIITSFDGMVCCIDTRTEFLLEWKYLERNNHNLDHLS